MNITCATCGKAARRTASQIAGSKRHYCTLECYWESLKGKEPPNKQNCIIKCSECGAPHRIPPSALRKVNFCSNQCRGKYFAKPRTKAGRITFPCLECGKLRNARRSLLRTSGLRFCGTLCANRWLARKHTGPGNSRYKGGPKAEKLRRMAVPQNALNARVSASVRSTLKRYLGSTESKRGRSWRLLVGYTPSQLFKRLTSTMPVGYTWADFGKLHIDHIRPISKFKFSSADDPQFKACWALSNLQLLTPFDNISKWNKYPA